MLTGTLTPLSLPSDLARVFARVGIDPAPAGGALRDLLRNAIASRGGCCDWTVDHTGWVVNLYLPEERSFSGGTLEEGLARCLAWLTSRESGI